MESGLNTTRSSWLAKFATRPPCYPTGLPPTPEIWHWSPREWPVRRAVFAYGLVWGEINANIVRLLDPCPNEFAVAPVVRDVNVLRIAVPDSSGIHVIGVPSWSISVSVLLADKNDINMILETNMFQEVVRRPAYVHVTLKNYWHFCLFIARASRKTPHACDLAVWFRESALSCCSGYKKHHATAVHFLAMWSCPPQRKHSWLRSSPLAKMVKTVTFIAAGGGRSPSYPVVDPGDLYSGSNHQFVSGRRLHCNKGHQRTAGNHCSLADLFLGPTLSLLLICNCRDLWSPG